MQGFYVGCYEVGVNVSRQGSAAGIGVRFGTGGFFQVILHRDVLAVYLSCVHLGLIGLHNTENYSSVMLY